jgi:hypothetical protein
MRRKTSQGIAFITALLLIACQRPEPLTAAKAEAILRQYLPSHEPVYAEVPQKVSFGPKSPEDDFDAKSVRTLQNLARDGYITLGEAHDADGTTTYIGHVTAKGFPLLGTAPSFRGPCFRAQICEKKYDGIRNFQRHPTEPTVGHAELIWHYANPTPLYALFETKLNKPLNKPFASLVAFYYKDFEWKFDVTVRKTDTE